MTLILDDLNDESPVFDSPSYQILLPEVRIIENGLILSITVLKKKTIRGGVIAIAFYLPHIHDFYFCKELYGE